MASELQTLMRAIVGQIDRAAEPGADLELLRNQTLAMLAQVRIAVAVGTGSGASVLAESIVGTVLHLVAENPDIYDRLRVHIEEMFDQIAEVTGQDKPELSDKRLRRMLTIAHDQMTECDQPIEWK